MTVVMIHVLGFLTDTKGQTVDPNETAPKGQEEQSDQSSLFAIHSAFVQRISMPQNFSVQILV